MRSVHTLIQTMTRGRKAGIRSCRHKGEIAIQMEQGIKDFVNLLLGKRLLQVHWEAEILDFNFETLSLHAFGCSRIIKNKNKIAVP